MSNHSGGYMLNEVLLELKESGITDKLTKEEKRKFVRKVLEIGRAEDCNDYEILGEMGKEFGLCADCGEDCEEFVGDCCINCHEDRETDEEEDS